VAWVWVWEWGACPFLPAAIPRAPIPIAGHVVQIQTVRIRPVAVTGPGVLALLVWEVWQVECVAERPWACPAVGIRIVQIGNALDRVRILTATIRVARGLVVILIVGIRDVEGLDSVGGEGWDEWEGEWGAARLIVVGQVGKEKKTVSMPLTCCWEKCASDIRKDSRTCQGEVLFACFDIS
jgi:hypothetical protein